MPTYRPPLATRSRAYLSRVRLRGPEWDFLNYMTEDIVKYEEDFLGNVSTAVATVNLRFTAGGAGTAAAFAAANNGTAALVCSSNGSSLYLNNKNWTADNNCTLSCRFNLSSAAAVKCEMGFVDTNTAAVIGATGSGMVSSFASTPTLVAGASDGTCVMMDSTGAITNPTYWHLVGSQAGTVKCITSLNTLAALRAPTASTYQTIVLQLRRVAIASEDVDAEFWVNGVSMGVGRLGMNTYNTALYPYIIVYSGSAGKTLTLDYFNVYQQRDMTN